MRKNILLAIMLFTSIFVSACKHKKLDPINVEIIGSWVSDDDSCHALFIKQNNQLVLSKFVNHDLILEHVPLISYNESVFSKFKSQNPNIKFSGMFTEGFILIDNKYCNSKLHKIDGFTPKKTSSGYSY